MFLKTIIVLVNGRQRVKAADWAGKCYSFHLVVYATCNHKPCKQPEAGGCVCKSYEVPLFSPSQK